MSTHPSIARARRILAERKAVEARWEVERAEAELLDGAVERHKARMPKLITKDFWNPPTEEQLELQRKLLENCNE